MDGCSVMEFLEIIDESNPFTGNVSYSYDPAGNRLARQKEAEPALTYSYDAGDRLVSDSSGNTYSYNSRGDLARVNNGSFEKNLTWDGKGRLVSVNDTEGTDTIFAYDPLNRTLGTSENGSISLKLYDMTSDMEIASLDGSQELKNLLFAGADGLISATSGEETSYFSFNPHSDASLITDESGNTKEELHYDAWGKRAEETQESNTYLGKHQRPEYHSLGLIKMGARFYDPETGRFISKDPLRGTDEAPISKNPYLYCSDDPVNRRDLSGKDDYSDFLRAQAAALIGIAMAASTGSEALYAQARELIRRADEHDKEVADATRKKQVETSPENCVVTSSSDLVASLAPVVTSPAVEYRESSWNKSFAISGRVTKQLEAGRYMHITITTRVTVAGARMSCLTKMTRIVRSGDVRVSYPWEEHFGPGMKNATHQIPTLHVSFETIGPVTIDVHLDYQWMPPGPPPPDPFGPTDTWLIGSLDARVTMR